MACGGWGALLKNTKHYGLEKEHMARFVNLVTSYVRPIKAVGRVYSVVSREYIVSIVRRSSSNKVATLSGLDHAINRGGYRENDRKQTEGIENNARKHWNNRRI